jgi:hypothetical protein
MKCNTTLRAIVDAAAVPVCLSTRRCRPDVDRLGHRVEVGVVLAERLSREGAPLS